MSLDAFLYVNSCIIATANVITLWLIWKQR